MRVTRLFTESFSTSFNKVLPPLPLSLSPSPWTQALRSLRRNEKPRPCRTPSVRRTGLVDQSVEDSRNKLSRQVSRLPTQSTSSVDHFLGLPRTSSSSAAVDTRNNLRSKKLYSSRTRIISSNLALSFPSSSFLPSFQTSSRHLCHHPFKKKRTPRIEVSIPSLRTNRDWSFPAHVEISWILERERWQSLAFNMCAGIHTTDLQRSNQVALAVQVQVHKVIKRIPRVAIAKCLRWYLLFLLHHHPLVQLHSFLLFFVLLILTRRQERTSLLPSILSHLAIVSFSFPSLLLPTSDPSLNEGRVADNVVRVINRRTAEDWFDCSTSLVSTSFKPLPFFFSCVTFRTFDTCRHTEINLFV